MIDLKSNKGKEIFRKLGVSSDVVIEPGYGQTGPLADRAGHDINYLAVSGILSKLGPKEVPSPTMNIVGDFAGGGLLCAFGICMALFQKIIR